MLECPFRLPHTQHQSPPQTVYPTIGGPAPAPAPKIGSTVVAHTFTPDPHPVHTPMLPLVKLNDSDEWRRMAVWKCTRKARITCLYGSETPAHRA